MKCPTCNESLVDPLGTLLWFCPDCDRLWGDGEIKQFWAGFDQGRNKKNTTEVCCNILSCGLKHPGCPSKECGSFVEPR